MDQFRYVGATPTDLDGGRPIGPGDFTGPIDVSEECPKNKQLLDDGLLILLPSEVVKDNEEKAARAEADEAKSEANVGKQESTSNETGKDGGKS